MLCIPSLICPNCRPPVLIIGEDAKQAYEDGRIKDSPNKDGILCGACGGKMDTGLACTNSGGHRQEDYGY